MADSPVEPALKRKRVWKACQTCRLMKTKCDGKHPACSRCQGYGYSCAYSSEDRRHRKAVMDSQQGRPGPPAAPAGARDEKLPTSAVGGLADAVLELDRLAQKVLPALPEDEKALATKSLASIRDRVQNACSKPRFLDSVQMRLTGATPRSQSCQRTPQTPAAQSQRYLGEVSDVRFFNLVKRALQEKNAVSSDRIDEEMDSYEQDEPVSQEEVTELSLELPDPAAAEEYFGIYFSTIHLAYPFLPKSSFMKRYKKIRESGVTGDIDSSWLALLHIIFAIGAYYTSFPGKGTDSMLHEHFFQRALSLSSPDGTERSVNQVSFLLAQCFYLLAVCRTDRCWTTLGLAVRIGQSIGLHVESIDDTKPLTGPVLLKAEMRRRMWYSVYVLDRLLALQLGRPPAIHDDDCHLPLPSRVDDADIDWDSGEMPALAGHGPFVGDYFLHVIAFSRIVGHVLRDLYSPRPQSLATDELLSTRSLDKQLLDWKLTLPRTLRFDFGHAFETSVIFKRQRNMLAIKFHHLRALIHRPYLCLPLLRHPDEASVALLQGEYHLLDRYEKICVSEAQETAHLLHNVVNERDLVHDFPWWQMISCLICASSVLLVASIFSTRAGISETDLDATALHDDAETCLKVFEALSANSDGARIARDMMTRLKERGMKWRDTLENRTNVHMIPVSDLHGHSAPPPMAISHADSSSFEHFDFGHDGSALGAQEWPSEILDSMAWSAQFFDAVQGTPPAPFDNPS